MPHRDLKGIGEVSRVFTAQSPKVKSIAEYKHNKIMYIYVLLNIKKYLCKLHYIIFDPLAI